MENLYSHVFHYNPYSEIWSAIPRDLYNDYWSNANLPGVIRSKEIKTLISLVNKGEEFVKELK